MYGVSGEQTLWNCAKQNEMLHTCCSLTLLVRISSNMYVFHDSGYNDLQQHLKHWLIDWFYKHNTMVTIKWCDIHVSHINTFYIDMWNRSIIPAKKHGHLEIRMNDQL